MKRALLFSGMLLCLGAGALDAQAICRQPSAFCADDRPLTADGALQEQRVSFQRRIIHVSKWLTAAGAVAFTVMASNQHQLSRRDWDALLEICRSAQDACLVGSDGKYVRADAEALYQRSRNYDFLANRWLMAAQVTLVATTALFIIDLNPGGGPENIPYPSQIRVGGMPEGAGVGVSWSF